MSQITRKSPLAWVGGKSKLTSTIIPLIPDHKCYVETFAGAAWVLFRKEPSKVEVVNDINSDLITFYRVLQNHLDEFFRCFEYSVVSREEFNRLKQQDEQTLTDIQRAARFYYLVKNSFGAKISSANFGVAKTSKPRLNFDTMKDELSKVKSRLNRVFIENLPYDQLIKRYDSKDTFFYCDPPYWDCENDYGKGLFGKDDFTKLKETLDQCQGKWLLSINNVDQIRTLFAGYYFKEVETTYSISSDNQKPVTELLIANYNIN